MLDIGEERNAQFISITYKTKKPDLTKRKIETITVQIEELLNKLAHIG